MSKTGQADRQRGRAKSKNIVERMTFTHTTTAGKVAALYVRVSQDEYVKSATGVKEHRASVEAQRQDAIAWAKSKGYSYKLYEQDCDISGHADAIDRPAIQAIIKDIEAGQIHTVYCREHSRFVRNEKLWQIMVWDYFYKYGVLYVDGDGTDITNPSGLLLASIKAQQNQNYLPDMAKKSMRSKVLKAEAGSLRTTPPYGYGVIEQDGIRRGYVKPDEAKIIVELFTRTASGEGAQILINDLIRRGITTKRKKHLHTSNLLRWLRNPIYKGIAVYNGTEYKSAYPAIVDAALWQKAQEHIADRASKYGIDRRRAANAHLLTGLLQCGYCCDRIEAGEKTPHPLFRNFNLAINKSWVGDRHNRKRVNYYTYRCQTKYKHHASSCPESISLKQDMIEAEVKTWVQAMIQADYASKLTTGSKAKALQAELETVQDRIAKLKDREATIERRYASLELDDAEHDRLVPMVKANLSKAEAELREIKQRMQASSTGATADTLQALASWDSLSIDEKKQGLLKLFDSIRVYADRLVVRYRANPTETVTLPLRYAKQRGTVIDYDAATKAARAYTFSPARIR